MNLNLNFGKCILHALKMEEDQISFHLSRIITSPLKKCLHHIFISKKKLNLALKLLIQKSRNSVIITLLIRLPINLMINWIWSWLRHNLLWNIFQIFNLQKLLSIKIKIENNKLIMVVNSSTLMNLTRMLAITLNQRRNKTKKLNGPNRLDIKVPRANILLIEHKKVGKKLKNRQ